MKRIRVYMSLICFFICFIDGYAQKVGTFQSIIRSKGKAQIGCSIIELANKDFIIAGVYNAYANNPPDAPDLEIVRTDSIGRIKWAKTFGGTKADGYSVYGSTGLHLLGGADLIISPDSNIVVCSTTESYGSAYSSAYLIKVDLNGKLKWSRTYGGTATYSGGGISVINYPGGGYLIAGNENYKSAGKHDVSLIRTNDTGAVVWSKLYGGLNEETANSIIKLHNGSFLISGTDKNSSGNYDILLLKVDKNGKLLWTKSYGLSNNAYTANVIELPDYSLYITANNANSSTTTDFGVITKLDTSGNLIWSKKLSGLDDYDPVYTIYDAKSKSLHTLAYGEDTSGSTTTHRWVLYHLNVDTSVSSIKYYKEYFFKGFSGSGVGNGKPIYETSDNHTVLIGETYGSSSLNSANNLFVVKGDTTGNTGLCSVTNGKTTISSFSLTDHTYTLTTTTDTPVVSTGCTVTDIALYMSDSSTCAPFVAGLGWKNPCVGQPIQFLDSSYQYATNWKWDFGDAGSSSNTSTAQNPTHSYSSTGTYTVKLVSGNGSVKDSISRKVTIYASPTPQATKNVTICVGDSTQLSATGGTSYLWNNNGLLSDTNTASTWAYPFKTTSFIAKVGNSAGCYVNDTFNVKVDTSSSSCTKYSKLLGVINKYAAITAFDSCYNGFTVDTTSFFKVGAKVLLIQMKGAVIDSSNTSTFGSVKNIGNAGNYEYVVIDSINNSLSKVFLKYQLKNKYDVGGLMQLVTVPVYGNAVVTQKLTAQPWNGKKGGVLIFEATGALYMGANIDVNGKGFAGGKLGSGGSTCHKSDYFYNSTSTNGANKGEGIIVSRNNISRGRGAYINGGGGGDSYESGGGGGGSYGNGGLGGNESAGCSGTTLANGGAGGINLATYIKQNRIFLGGGGGAAYQAFAYATPGVNGGGLVFIKAAKVIGAGDTIRANGLSPTVPSSSDGSGGAGAAGAILLNVSNYPTKLNIQAYGGKGGDNNYYLTFGPGGGGGGGALALSNALIPSKIKYNLAGGLPGLELYSSSSYVNTSYGADSGRSGAVLNSYIIVPQSTTLFAMPSGKVTSSYKSICVGDSAQLTATGGAKYIWSPGTLLNDSTSASPYAYPFKKTTFTVKIYNSMGCYVTDTVSVKADTTKCGLNKIGGVINSYAAVTAFDTCNLVLTLDTTSFFKKGDKVLLIQMKGAVVDTSNTSSFGSIKSIGNAGNYEYVTLDSVNSTQVRLKYQLLKKYDLGGLMQLVTVPQYSNIYVSKKLTAQAWNGTKGGVLIFEASGKVILGANIDVSGRGFQGGAIIKLASNCGKTAYYYSTSGDGDTKGEGIAIAKSTYSCGRGAIANGGGGGNGLNSGGGGGSNYAAGAIGGKQHGAFCSSTTGAITWGLGGYALANYIKAGNIFLGGGGGAGHEYTTSTGTSGTNGGGIVLIKAQYLFGETDSIKANGLDQTIVTSSTDEGAGGGGGAGSVFLNIGTYKTGLVVWTKGGKGGNVNNYECVGPGGGGSGGSLLSTGSSISTWAKFGAPGGLPGINIYTGSFAGCPLGTWGADTGKVGAAVTGLSAIPIGNTLVVRSPVSITTKYKKICLGDSVQLIAKNASTYTWSPGISLSDSNIANPYAFPVSTTTYTVKGYSSGGCYTTDTVTIAVDTSAKCITSTKISGVINNYAAVQSIDTCYNSVTVDSTKGFSVGDIAILMQMQGATMDSTNTSSFGSIKSYNGAGNYEYVTIDSIAGKTIYFRQKLLLSYDVKGIAQLIRVPQYSGNVIVTKRLTAQPWNGIKGGVLTFNVTGKVYMLADIDAAGKGFRGGSLINFSSAACGSSIYSDYYYDVNSSQYGAKKGEGISLYLSTKSGGRGAQTNGGGGGNNHNAGAGGGANYGKGGQGGYTYNVCKYTTNTAAGGYALQYSNAINKVYLGGGGGSGHENDGYGTSGMNGGGIILINASSIIGGLSKIKSNGLSQTTATQNDGAGAAGAGGTVLLKVPNVKGYLNINVAGGRGGDVDYPLYSQCYGPGGGGGGGVVWLSSSSKPSNIITNISAGQSGLDINSGSPCVGTSYGADSGRIGAIITGLNIPQGNISFKRTHVYITRNSNKTGCPGDSVQLFANGAVKYVWSPGYGLSDSTVSNPYAFPVITTKYTVNGYSSSGCMTTDTITINVDTSAKNCSLKKIGGVINKYSAVKAIDTCFNMVTVDSVFVSVGDKALIIQMKGATIDSSNTSSFGSVLSLNQAGNYEYVIIDSVSGTKIYFKNKLLNYYNPTGLVQLVTVPQYSSIYISSRLTAQPWNGVKGGILVFDASGSVMMAANMDVAGKGFRGGDTSVPYYSGSCTQYSNYYYSYSSGNGGRKGEGIAEYKSSKEAGKGAQANGGGGGNSVNASGAGGGNGGVGGIGSKTYSACSYSENAAGGLANSYSNTINRIFFGGGGGGGQQNDHHGTAGRNGGGIILVSAKKILTNSSSIIANGDSQTIVAGNDGSGGGGAGGTVLLNVPTYSGKVVVNVKGGGGGNSNYGAFSQCYGGGSGGGGGVVWFSSAPSLFVSKITKGGMPGIITNSSSACYNTSYGADSGRSGKTLTALQRRESTKPFIRLDKPFSKPFTKSICSYPYDSVKLTASRGTFYSWSPGKSLSDSTIISPYAKPTKTTVYVAKVSNASGCFVRDTFIITAFPTKPPTPAIVNATDDWSEKDTVWNTTCRISVTIPTVRNIASMTLYTSVDGGPFTQDTTAAYKGNRTYNLHKIGLDETKHYYTYIVIAKDSCGHYSDTSLKVSPAFLRVKALNLRNYLHWRNYVGFTKGDSIYIFRKKPSATFWSILAGYRSSDTSYMDTSLMHCGDTYIYTIYTAPLGGGIAVSYSDSFAVTTFDTVAPASVNIIKASVTTGTNIALQFNKVSKAGIRKYLIYARKNSGSFVLIDSVLSKGPSVSNYTYNYNVSALKDTFAFKVFALDSCSNQSRNSPIHRAIQLNGKALDDSSYLSWSAYQGFTVKSYSIQRRKKNTAWADLYTGIPASTTTYTAPASCNDSFYYRIRAVQTVGSSDYALSDSILIIPFDTISPPRDSMISASVIDGSHIQITFNKVSPTDVIGYYIYRSKNGAAYTKVATVSRPSSSPITFTDNINALTDTFSYEVFAFDSCGNTAKNAQFHRAIQLNGKALDDSSFLSWAAYKGFTVKSYTIQTRKKKTAWTDTYTGLSASTTSYTAPGSCKDSFYYRIKAVQNGGNNAIVYSDSAMVSPFDTVSPAKDSMISVSVMDSTHIKVNFNKVADVDVTGYDIYRSKNGGAYVKITTISRPKTSPLSYIDNINTLADTFSYKIFAVDSCGNTAKKSAVHRAVQLNGKALDDSSYLSWSSYQGFVVKNYTLQTWSSTAGWVDTYTGISPAITRYIAPGSCNVLYRFRIKAIENGGNNAVVYSDSIAIKPFDTIKPAEPTIKSVSVISATNIVINWAKSSSTDVKNYNLYRQNTSGTWVNIASLGNVSTYTDTVISTGKSYCYSVQAQDSCAANKSGLCSPHCSMALKASLKGCDRVNYLNWSAYSGWASVSKYEIYRTINGGTESLLATNTGSSISYSDTGLSYHNNYCYRIKAYDASGNTSYSNSICQKVSFVDTPTVIKASKIVTSATTGQLVVKWKTLLGKPHLSYVNLYYSLGGSSYSLLKGNIPVAQDSFIHTGINTRVGEHYYYIIAVDSCHTSSEKSGKHKSMDLTVSIGQLLHKLNWTPYKGYSVQKYYIQRYIGGRFVTVDSTVSDTFSRKFPAPCNSTIHYRIAAIGAQPGQIAYSDSMGRVAIDTTVPNRAIINNLTVLSGSSTRLDFRGSDSLDVYAYYIQRKEGGKWGTASQILFNGPGKQITYKDKADAFDSTLSYTVITVDSCLNMARTDTFSAIQLTGNKENLSDSIKWFPFKGYKINTYYIERYRSANKWDTLASVTGKDTLYFHSPLPCNVPVTYRIRGLEKPGGRVTLSDTITLVPFDTIKPPAIVIKYATVVKNGRIDLSWNPSISKVKIYEVGLKQGNGPWKVVDTTRLLTQTITGINTLDSINSFRIVAIDSCANNRSPYSIVHTPVQLDGKARNLADSLNWQSYKGFTKVKQYYIYHFVGGSWQKLDSVAGNVTIYYHKGLPCNVPQTYRIGAQDISGAYISMSDTITLTPFDTIKPNAPLFYYASVQPDRSIKVGWQWDLKSDIKYFEIWRSVNKAPAVKIANITYDSTYIDKTVNPSTNAYAYYIIAIDSCSSLNRSKRSDADTTMNLKLSSAACVPLIKLSWTAYHELQKGTTGYNIYRADASTPFAKIASVTGGIDQWTDNTVKAGIRYWYKVKATGKGTPYSSFSDTMGLQPWIFPIPDTTHAIYTSVSATGSSTGAIYVQWKRAPVSDTFAKGYHLYHSLNGGPFTLILDQKDLTKTSFIQANINTVSAIHDYYVAIYNLCSIEGQKSKAHQPILLQGLNNNLSISLNWTKYVGQQVNKYLLYRTDNNGKAVLMPVKQGDTTYIDTNIQCKHHYNYRVEADLASGDISYSDSVAYNAYDKIPPVHPKIILVTVDSTSKTKGKISISYLGNSEKNRTGYNLYRSVNGSKFALRTYIPETKIITPHYWQDEDLDTKDSTYSYYLTAIDSCGNESVPSDTHIHVHLVAKAYSQTIKVDWSNYQGWKKWTYVLERSKNGSVWAPIDTFRNNVFTYNDSNINCHNYYRYRIRAVDADSNWLSFSNMDGDTAFETVKPFVSQIRRVTVTASSAKKGKILIEWNASKSKDTYGYHLYRSEDGINWTYLTGRPIQALSFVDSNLSTTSKSYYYRIQPIDSCGNVGAGYSTTHKSILMKIVPGNQEARVSWNAYKGWKVKNYLVYKNGVPFDTLDSTTFTIIDTMVTCKTMYTYTVLAVCDSINSLLSYSNIDSTTVEDHKAPYSPYLKYVTVFDQKNKVAKLEWEHSASFDVRMYYVYRKTVDGRMSLIDSTTGLTYFDSSRIIKDPDCYTVIAADYCGNISKASNKACLIILKGSNESNYNALNWNNYQDWLRDGIKKYQVYKREDNSAWDTIGSTPVTIRTYNDKILTSDVIDYCYQVEAQEKQGNYNAFSRSTILCLRQAPIVHIPNIFSPYIPDGLNDNFGPIGMYIKQYDMQIYNRWGQRVYSTENGTPWDGNFQGQLVPEGVYLYHVTVYGYNGEKLYFKGTVTILK